MFTFGQRGNAAQQQPPSSPDVATIIGLAGGRGREMFLLEFPTMSRLVFALITILLVSVQAEARFRHHTRYQLMQSMASIPSDERIVNGRPSGCPHAFCGCEASLYKFGRIIPELNLASNWRRFPRATPAPGMAAVRSGHVMILQQQVSGNVWNVHDGNSGGHVTREHPRSITGYTIVDPSSPLPR